MVCWVRTPLVCLDSGIIVCYRRKESFLPPSLPCFLDVMWSSWQLAVHTLQVLFRKCCF
jgi:hypothetical protein